jgi:hypothetical protein
MPLQIDASRKGIVGADSVNSKCKSSKTDILRRGRNALERFAGSARLAGLLQAAHVAALYVVKLQGGDEEQQSRELLETIKSQCFQEIR